MSTFQELYGVGHMETVNFFYAELTDLVPQGGQLTTKETIYVASVLAHYAQTSRYETESMPPLADLGELFDHFVLELVDARDTKMLEIAGAQSLLFAGFFGDQMKEKHSLSWYNSIGSSFYEKACRRTRDANRKTLLGLMSWHFPAWARHCRELNRTLRENQFNRFLIKPSNLES